MLLSIEKRRIIHHHLFGYLKGLPRLIYEFKLNHEGNKANEKVEGVEVIP